MKITRRYRPSPAVVDTLRVVVQADLRGGLRVDDWRAPGAPNKLCMRGLVKRRWVHQPFEGAVYRATNEGKRALRALDKLAAEEAQASAAPPPAEPIQPHNRPSPAAVAALRQVAACGDRGLTVTDWTAPGLPDPDQIAGLVRRRFVEHPFGSEIYRVTPLGLAALRQLDGPAAQEQGEAAAGAA